MTRVNFVWLVQSRFLSCQDLCTKILPMPTSLSRWLSDVVERKGRSRCDVHTVLSPEELFRTALSSALWKGTLHTFMCSMSPRSSRSGLMEDWPTSNQKHKASSAFLLKIGHHNKQQTVLKCFCVNWTVWGRSPHLSCCRNAHYTFNTSFTECNHVRVSLWKSLSTMWT